MDKKGQNSYNFSSVDLLIYIWKKRLVLIIVGLLAGIGAIIASLLITPMYKSNVIMFPVTDATISKSLLAQNYSGRQGVYAFGEEEQAEQLLQVLNSESIRTHIIDKYNLMDHYEIDPNSKYPVTQLYEAYKSNVNFKLTEFMSVEITVMDSDPVYASDIANDISALVDTVFNNMKKQRSLTAFKLVEKEYLETVENTKILQDSMKRLTANITFEKGAPVSDDMILQFAMADPQNSAVYISLITRFRQEIGRVSEMKARYNEARLEAQQNLPYKFIVESAVPAEKKAYPNKSLIVIVSTFASLLLALVILIIIDNIKARISEEEK
jgi:uncharacterized protein involved in exopolysaccharide biosynthesis